MKVFTSNYNNSNNYILNRLLDSYPELVTEEILSSKLKNDIWRITPTKNTFGPEYIKKSFTGCTYCPFAATNQFDYVGSFEAAIRRLNKYAKEKYGDKQLYDFKLADGTPVKEYQNFIQVGYNIIPKENYRNYYRDLSLKDKVAINTIVVTINNTINLN